MSETIFKDGMTVDEKVEALFKELEALKTKVDTLTPAVSTPTGGLYKFVRPPAGTPRYGLGTQMTSADVEEAEKRAMSCVNWRGGQTRSTDEDMVWNEIEKLKKGVFTDIKPYIMLDPEFCGFALLTGLIEPASMDGRTFGVSVAQREAYAGVTVQSFLDSQFSILFGGGAPSGE